MARANLIQTNFTSGEISPFMYGRVDINKYFNGAKKLRNMVIKPQGGAVRRSGSRYVNSVKTQSKYTRLRAFIFSDVQAYILEFGDLYVRIYKDGGIVESSPGVPVEVVTPYLESELDSLCFAQSADVLYITSATHQPQKLSRTSHTSWTLSAYAPADGPYLDTDTSGKLITLEVTSDVTTLVSNLSGSTVAIASASLFVAGDVGKYVEYVRLNDLFSRNHYSLLLITAYTSGTQVAVTNQDSNVVDLTGQTVTFSSGQIHTSESTFKTSTSVGKFVRLSASQAWYQITSVVNGTTANATAVTIVSYTTPTTVTPQSGFASGDVNKFVEYSKDGRWHLAKILTFVSSSTVLVQVINPILLYDKTVDINFSSTTGNINVTSPSSGVFAPGDKGKYVRDAQAQRWAKITGYTNSSSVPATVQSLFTYSFPEVTMNLRDDRVVSTRMTSTEELFNQSDIGRPVRLQFGSQWRCVTITDIVSAFQVLGTANDYIPWDDNDANDLYNGGQADNFRNGAWSTATGWPAIISFHDQRLVFARTTTQPQTFWMTRTGDYEDMAPSELDSVVLDDSAITVTIASGRANPITWMETGPVLLIGTSGAEFQVKPASVSKGIAPTNISVVPQTAFGSIDPDDATRSGSSVLFIQRGGTKLREMVYDFNVDAFTSRDLTIISEHILRQNNGAIASAFQNQPSGILWLVLANGKLAGVTYDREQEVVAWHLHELGGSGIVESVATIPGTDRDEVYLIVRRTINGGTKRYIERIEAEFDTAAGHVKADAFFVDSGLTYSGTAATTISGLSHLEGATVQVLADGVSLTKTVSSGAITLTTAASKVHVGFGSDAIVGTIDYEGGSQAGTSQGKRKRISEVILRVKDSMPFYQGPDESHYDKLPSQHFGDVDTSGSVFTGDVRFSLDQSYDGGGFFLKQSEPFPFIVTAIMPMENTNE